MQYLTCNLPMWLMAAVGSILIFTGAPGQAAMGDNMVGMNVHIPSPAAVELAADLGIGWVRMDNNWRNHGNPCSDDMTPEPNLVTAVTHAVAQGLQVYMNLISPHPCGTLDGEDDVDFNNVPIASLFANYVRQTVAIYRGLGVRHYSLWNEPNQELFYEGTIEQLVNHVFIPGFAAVAQGCREAGYDDCLVLGPELAHQGDYDVYMEDILRRLQAAGLMFDILTHHNYQAVSTPIFERDSYINAVDDRRFPFTRRSLVDVLEDVGLAHNGVPDLEVWITETGYFVSPPTDPGEMRAQANHFMEALNVQLERPWLTNTFFYEMIDPRGAEGYGITALNSDGSFFLKDAYLTLQQRLAADPRLSGPAPPSSVPNVARICSRLGSRRFFSFLDQDPYRFHGSEGELVTVRLAPDPNGDHRGDRATLTLEGGGLTFRWSMSDLPNDLITTLPRTRTYHIKVIEQTGAGEGSKFTGDYCVTLESSQGAYRTLERD